MRQLARVSMLAINMCLALVLLSGSAEATSKSVACYGVVYCWGNTSWGIESELDLYRARGTAQSYIPSEGGAPVSIDLIQAVTKGTNIDHSGDALDWSECHRQPGSGCTNGWRYYCDTGGVVCGSSDLDNWYATTMSLFQHSSWGLTQQVFTATTSSYSRDTLSCYVDMDCF